MKTYREILEAKMMKNQFIKNDKIEKEEVVKDTAANRKKYDKPYDFRVNHFFQARRS